DCHYIDADVSDTDLVLARVAGFDRAVYGLPEETAPVLFQTGDLLVATMQLSRFVTARYAPPEAWTEIWRAIISHLLPQAPPVPLVWQPRVLPSFAPEHDLPAAVETRAIRRGVEWFYRAKLLVHPS